MKVESILIYSRGKRLHGNLHLPKNKKAPCIVTLHGLESSKDSGKWPILASRFCEAGFSCLRFSFMGCGEGEERSEGHFEDTSLTERIRNYEAAIRFLEETDTVDKDRLAAVGSSFGGMVSIAAQNKKMKAVVALSTPYNLQGFDRLYQKQAYHVLPSGSRLKENFFKDLKAYDVLKAVKDAPPILIIHGDKDELVPVEHAYRLYENAKKPKKLEIIESAGHSFYQTKNLCKVAKLSVNWFKKHL